MAGGKESPRQKLVNMMYLVLTAMLALQVSAAILEKFILINRSIESAVRYQLVENDSIIDRVTKMVHDSGRRKSDVEVLTKMHNIRTKTKKIVNYIESIKTKLILNAGNKSRAVAKLKGLKNDHVVTSLMINEKKGEELRDTLNSYVKYISTQTGKVYDHIALDARDIDFLKDDPNQGIKDFVTLNFYKSPLASALATLSQFMSQVVYKEADALNVLARLLGAEDFKLDTIVPVVIPRSNIVVSGDRYQAEVVAAASSSSAGVKMKVNGKEILVKNGKGIIDFPVKMTKMANNTEPEKRMLKIDIEMKNQQGRANLISGNFAYYIAKPVIRVESGSVARLYSRCKNPLNILVPALGSSYDPKFKIKGANIVNKGGGKIEVIPTDKKVSIDVYQGKVLLGTENFEVKKIPLPAIKLLSQGKALDEKIGVSAATLPRNIKISVVADSNFKELLPNEAKYKVSKGTIILAYGSQSKARIPIRSRSVDINKLASMAKPGDRIVVEVTEVLRATNFGNGIEKIRIGSMIKTIPIT